MERTSGLSGFAPGSATAAGVDLEMICPTCGQWLETETSTPSWQPKRHPWWPWALVVVGLYVVGFFGSGLRGLSPAQVFATWSTAQIGMKPEVLRYSYNLDLWAKVTHQLEGLALGGAAVVVGLGAVALRKRDPASTRHGGVVETLVTAWLLAERVSLSAFRLLLVIACLVALSEIVQGQPPTWDVVNVAIDRTLDVVVAVVDVTLGSLRLVA